METTLPSRGVPETARTCRGLLIGAGHAAWMQLQAWARIEHAEIVAIANRTRSRAQALSDEFDIPAVYSDYRVMLESEQAEFLDIATPPVVHGEMVAEAAMRGLAVLCQKPIAGTLTELREMIRVCHEHGVRFMVNENGSFQPWFRDLKPLLAQGIIGRTHYLNITTRRQWNPSIAHSLSPPDRQFDRSWLNDRPRHITYELGVHFLDALRYLFGEANTVYAHMRRVDADVVGETLSTVMLDLGQMTAVVDMSWSLIGRSAQAGRSVGYGDLRIEGDMGTLHLRNGLLQLLRKDGREDVRQYPPDWEVSSYQAAQQHFIDCLASGADFETSGPETLKTMELVFGAYDSAEHKRVYRVGEDLDRLD